MRAVLVLTMVMAATVVSAADNMMINADIQEISFQQPPAIAMAFRPEMEPGVVVSIPGSANTIIPGYRVRHDGVAYIVGIACEADMADDCSAYPYAEDYKGRDVYIRYQQTSDRSFRTPEGAAVGDRWGRTLRRLDGGEMFLSGNDSCVKLPSGWHACIDLMSTQRRFDSKMRRLLPKKNAKLDFFYQINGDN